MKEIYNNIIFILLGFCVFSSVCTTISSDILHAPFTVPEIIILPFIFLRKAKFCSLKLNVSLFFTLLLISLILIIIASIYDIFDLSSILSCARCYIYLFAGICLFDSNNKFTADDLLYLCLGSIIGWAYTSYSNLQFLMYERSDAYISYGLFMGIPMFLCLALSRKRYAIFSVGLLFLIIVFMFAGIRRVVAVFVISLLFYLFFNLVSEPKRFFPLLILFGFFVGLFYLILPWMESTVMELSPYLYYRMFARSQDAMGSNLDTSDMTRLDNLTLLSNTDTNLLFPHGFNTIRYDKVVGSGVFNDVPIFSISWIIGLPFTIILLLYIAIKGYKAYRYYVKTRNSMSLSVLVCLLCMYSCLFLDGTFMTFVYAAPFTGICIGKILLFSSKKVLV